MIAPVRQGICALESLPDWDCARWGEHLTIPVRLDTPALLMKTPLVLCFSAAVFFAPLVTRADNEIGFIEKFALAQDREAVLSQLLPGSEDFYFFHALHYQNTKQAAKLAQ